MHRADRTAGIDIDHARVQAVPAAIRRALHDAEINRDGIFPGHREYAIEVACLDAHRLLHVMPVQLFLQGGFEACAVGPFHPERVPRHQRFAERDESATLGGGLADASGDLCEGSIALQPDRRDLGDRHRQRIFRFILQNQ
jgi:hypothetical protein